MYCLFSLEKSVTILTYSFFRFKSSNGGWTSLAEYVERMKEKQEQIFFIAGQNEQEVTESPFVERLLKKGRFSFNFPFFCTRLPN